MLIVVVVAVVLVALIMDCVMPSFANFRFITHLRYNKNTPMHAKMILAVNADENSADHRPLEKIMATALLSDGDPVDWRHPFSSVHV